MTGTSSPADSGGILGSGPNFVQQLCSRRCQCSECGRWLAAGDSALVSLRKGKVQKRVCGENCRLEFDARYWDERAAARQHGGGGE